MMIMMLVDILVAASYLLSDKPLQISADTPARVGYPLRLMIVV